MLRSSFAHSPRAKAALAKGHSQYLPHVESLEDRRLLSVNGWSIGTYQLFVDYYRAMYARSNPTPYRTLDSLLNRKVELIVERPGLREELRLPDTVSSTSIDAAMDNGVGVDDDWFSIDSRKRSLLDEGGLKWRPQ